MPVIADDYPVDEGAAPIHGRPDFDDHDFGVTRARRFPPYVFSIRGGSCLVHRVAKVELQWWRLAFGGHGLVKLKRPVMHATTACGTSFRLGRHVSRTCQVPAPGATLCGRCHGQPATFGQHGAGTAAGVTRRDAHVRLGCAVRGY